MDAHGHPITASAGAHGGDHHEIEIPFTVHARPDTGLYNGKLGIWLFLASEVMLFGALFSTLILLRTGAPSWPHGWEVLKVGWATANTFVLVPSRMPPPAVTNSASSAPAATALRSA